MAFIFHLPNCFRHDIRAFICLFGTVLLALPTLAAASPCLVHLAGQLHTFIQELVQGFRGREGQRMPREARRVPAPRQPLS